MLNLSDREWKEFFIGGNEGIFKIRSSSSGIDKGKLLMADETNVPYVTRSDKNNGIDLFVAKQNKKVDLKNVITIGLDTQTIFYQPHAFYTGQNIQVLSNPFLNKYVAMFIIPLLKSQMVKFNWGGNGATLTRLNRTKLLLPIDKNGNPDYEFMEQYVKEQENRKREEYIKHIKNELHDIEYREIKKWEELEWKDFQLGNLFEIYRGNAKGISDLKDNGETAIISALDNNNGFYLSTDIPDGEKIYKHRLTVNNNGNGVCLSYYHDYNFVASSDVSILSPERKELSNKYVCLFISTAIRQQKIKYCYGYKMNNTRMKNQIICLPINANNEPDYEFMEQYMKNHIYLRYIQYLIEREIENSNYKILRLYTEGYGVVTSFSPSNTSSENSTRYVFDLKNRELLITLDFSRAYNINFYLANILSEEIIEAINTRAIKLKFRTSNPDEMDEFSEGYEHRTNLVILYLEKYKITIPKNKYDVWVKY